MNPNNPSEGRKPSKKKSKRKDFQLQNPNINVQNPSCNPYFAPSNVPPSTNFPNPPPQWPWPQPPSTFPPQWSQQPSNFPQQSPIWSQNYECNPNFLGGTSSFQSYNQSMGSNDQSNALFSHMGSYDQHSTPVGGESSDENDVECEEDEPVGRHSVPLGDDNNDEDENDEEENEEDEEGHASPHRQPTLQELLAQFTAPPTFTQLLSQPAQQPPPAAPKANKKSWDLVEDICLISCVMNVSTNAVVGTNQKIRVMWGKVTEAYEQARGERPHEIAPRTLDMVKGRFKRVAAQCLKWAGCFDEACRRKRSGTTDADVLREAHLIFQRKWGKFTLMEQWKVLDKFQKWKAVANSMQLNPRGRQPTAEIGSGSSGKRSRTDDDVPDPDTPTSVAQGGSSSRPEGVKKAKARMTGKMVADHAVEALNSFGDTLRLTAEERSKRDELMSQKLAIQMQKEARKQKQLELEEYRMKWDMYTQLSQKTNLMPWESELLSEIHAYLISKKGI